MLGSDPQILRRRPLDKLAQLARRSLELGDVSGVGRVTLALFYLLNRDHDESLRVSAAALADRPSCQVAYSSRANILNLCGRPEEAIAPAKYAIRLSPIVATFYPAALATSYYLLGRHEESLDAADQAFVLAPDNLDARLVAVASLVETDRLEAATVIANEVCAGNPGFTIDYYERSKPFRDPSVVERLVDSLERAGLPRRRSATFLSQPRFGSKRRSLPRPRH